MYHQRLLTVCLCLGLMSACFSPPYNDFKPERPITQATAVGTGIGAIVGAALGTPAAGAGIGAAGGALVGIYKRSRPYLLKELNKNDIELIEYQHTATLIIPTDIYFKFHSPEFHELQYHGLAALIAFLRTYPHAVFHVAGFSDRANSVERSLMLVEARVHTMLAFLYANGVPADHLTAEAIGPHFAIGDNFLIHGSAYNRRLEIQWDLRDERKRHNCCHHKHEKIIHPDIAVPEFLSRPFVMP